MEKLPTLFINHKLLLASLNLFKMQKLFIISLCCLLFSISEVCYAQYVCNNTTCTQVSGATNYTATANTEYCLQSGVWTGTFTFNSQINVKLCIDGTWITSGAITMDGTSGIIDNLGSITAPSLAVQQIGCSISNGSLGFMNFNGGVTATALQTGVVFNNSGTIISNGFAQIIGTINNNIGAVIIDTSASDLIIGNTTNFINNGIVRKNGGLIRFTNNGKTVVNNGTIWNQQNGDLGIYGGVEFINNGVLKYQGFTELIGGPITNTNTWINNYTGAIADVFSLYNNVFFTNSGTVYNNSGNLMLGIVTNITNTAGATFTVNNGNINFNNNAIFTNDGNLKITGNGGVNSICGNAVFNNNGRMTIQNGTLDWDYNSNVFTNNGILLLQTPGNTVKVGGTGTATLNNNGRIVAPNMLLGIWGTVLNTCSVELSQDFTINDFGGGGIYGPLTTSGKTGVFTVAGKSIWAAGAFGSHFGAVGQSLDLCDAGNPVGGWDNINGYAVAGDITYCVKNPACPALNLQVSITPKSDSVCAGTNDPLSVSIIGGLEPFTYSWSSNPFGYISTDSVANTYPLVNTTYTVTVTDATLNSGTASVAITVNPLPIPIPSSNSPVCEGSILTLDVSTTFTSYSWAGSDTYTSIIKNPTVSNTANSAMAGIYTITVIDANLCSNTATTAVIINSLPIPKASSNTPVCAGDTLNLTGGSNGFKYKWTGPNSYTSTTQSPIVSDSAIKTMEGNYKIVVTDSITGCRDSLITLVVINPLPIPTAGNDSPKCVGESLNITSGPDNMNYFWTGPNSYINGSNTTPNIVNVSTFATKTMEGTYKVVVTDLITGCKDSITTTVIINALPVKVATNNSPLCEGHQLQLTGGDTGNIYKWVGPNNFSSTDMSPVVSDTAKEIMEGKYRLVLTVPVTGCIDSAFTTVVINPLPVVDEDTSFNVCVGQAINVTCNQSNYGYYWQGPDNFMSADQSPNVTNYALKKNEGVYKVVLTDLTTSCTDSALTTVTVNLLPTVSVSTNSPVCAGHVLQLTGSSNGTTYAWSGPGYTDITISPKVSNQSTLAMAGVYTLVVTDVNNCIDSSKTISVVINPLPTPSASSNSPVCKDLVLTLNGGTDAAYTYNWIGPAAFTSTTQSPTVSVNADFAMAGIYRLITTIPATGCNDSAFTTVTINGLPTVKAGEDASICYGKSYDILASGNGSSYAWSPSGTLSTATSTSTIATPETTTTYIITAIDGNGCSASDNIAITVNSRAFVQNSVSALVCYGFSHTFNTLKNFGETYVWYDAATDGKTLVNGEIFTRTAITQSDTLYIESISSYGCKSEYRGMAIINLGIQPIADFTVNADSIKEDETVQFTNKSINAYKYAWNFDEENAVSEEENPSYRYFNAGNKTVQLIVTSTDGCMDTLIKADGIKVAKSAKLFIPSAFSPNGDNQNDLFEVYGENIKDMHIKIFNEWGLLVWEADKQSSTWDGTTNGKVQPAANYAFVFTCIQTDDSSLEQQGVVTLIR